MANFCRNCGVSVPPNAAFCGNCGSQQTTGQPNTAPASSFPAASARGTRNNLGKFLLIAFACVALLLTAAGVGVYYAVHKVKQIAAAKVHEYGLDTSSSSAARTAVRHLDVCSLLSVNEATKLLHEPVTRSEKELDQCLYYGSPGLAARLAREQMNARVKESQNSANHVDAAGVADAVTNLAGSLANEGAIAGHPGREMPLLTVTVAADGKSQMVALRASKALFSGVEGAGADIPDLGDRAIQLANLGLNVLQGDLLLRIVPGPVPKAHERSIDVAREILPRLSAAVE